MLMLPNREAFSAHMPQRGVVAEIGVHKGEHAKIIWEYNKPEKLYLIDCWERQTGDVYETDPTNSRDLNQAFESVSEMFAFDYNVKILKMYSETAAKSFPDDFFDWVYIDANHTYDAVLKDLNLWWPKVKVGGFLCGHDYMPAKKYTYIEVREALETFGKPLYMLTDEKYGS